MLIRPQRSACSGSLLRCERLAESLWGARAGFGHGLGAAAIVDARGVPAWLWSGVPYLDKKYPTHDECDAEGHHPCERFLEKELP